MQTIKRLETFVGGPASLAAIFYAAFLTVCVGQGAASGDEMQKPVTQKTQTQPDAEAAAKRALVPLQKLVDDKTYKEMGFDNPSEVASAILVEPINVSMVRLDALSQYAMGGNPERLLAEPRRVIYPVEVNKQVKSSIIVEGADAQWKATSFGGPHLVRQIARYRSDVNEKMKPETGSMRVVHVAGLNLYFLGYRVNGPLMLTPLDDYTTFKLTAGKYVMFCNLPAHYAQGMYGTLTAK